jgi:hypothetical protein
MNAQLTRRERHRVAGLIAVAAVSGVGLCSSAQASPLGLRAQWTPRTAAGVAIGATAVAAALHPSRVGLRRLASVSLSFRLVGPASVFVNVRAAGHTHQLSLSGRAGTHRRNLGRALKRFGVRARTHRLRVFASNAAGSTPVTRPTLRVR